MAGNPALPAQVLREAVKDAKDRLYLLDIAEACEKVGRYIAGVKFEDLVKNEILFDATIRNLQNIGDAVSCLPQETREIRPQVEWSRIVNLRHLLDHRYFGVDEEIVWDLAVNRCPELLAIVREILELLPPT